MIDTGFGYRVTRASYIPHTDTAVMYTVHITRLVSFITFYTRVQTFANIYKYSAMKGANRKREELRELASHSRRNVEEMNQRSDSHHFSVLSDDPRL